MDVRRQRGAGFFLLIDPDRSGEKAYLSLTEVAQACGVDAILVGTSFMLNADFPEAVRRIKEATSLPVLIFPGSFAQVAPHADAILFTSLISGRNPNYLIEEQVRGAPLVKRYGLEAIPTGYLLIQSGARTSVQYITDTQPIPDTKYDIACAHALAAQYLGMRFVYLEAGSGAPRPVAEQMVSQVTAYVDIPVIVGGGLTTPQQCADRIAGGASFVVVGNTLETDPDFSRLTDMTAAVHEREVYTP